MAREQRQREREVITEFLELYRDLPCLWDLTCDSYKDSIEKNNAWDILATKLKDIDPTANAASAKRKIDKLRISYTRESKKVKESKNRPGSSTSDVHKPSLWYYKLLTFLEKNNEVKRKGIDPLKGDDEDEQKTGGTKRKKLTKERNIKIKKEKQNATKKCLSKTTETNAFGVYVGKTIEEIPRGLQRDLAEKLISEIMFLAKTNNLTFDTRIDIPSGTHSNFVNVSPSSSNSYQIQIQSSPSPSSVTQRNSLSPASSHSYIQLKMED